MTGLLNSPAAVTPTAAPAPSAGSTFKATPSGAFNDPILKKIESQLISKLAPNLHSQYQSAVNAGMNAIYGQQMGAKIMARLQATTNPQADIPRLVANVMATIVNEVIGQMPMAKRQQYEATFIPSLLAASVTLTCHVMDTLEKMGKFQVTSDAAGQIIQAVTMACLQKIGISPQQVQHIVAQRGAQGAQ